MCYISFLNTFFFKLQNLLILNFSWNVISNKAFLILFVFIAITSSWRRFSIFLIIFCDIILSLFPFLDILLCSFLILINNLVLADKYSAFFFFWYFLKQVYNTESSFFSHWSYCFWKLIEFDCCVKLLLNNVESFVICLNVLSPSSVNLHCVLLLLQLLFFLIYMSILNMNALWLL